MSNSRSATTLGVVSFNSDNYLLVADTMLFLNSFWDSRIPTAQIHGKTHVKVSDVTWAVISDRASNSSTGKVGVFSVGDLSGDKLSLNLKALFDATTPTPTLTYPYNNDLSALGLNLHTQSGAKTYTALIEHVKNVSNPHPMQLSDTPSFSEGTPLRSGTYNTTIYRGEPSVVVVFPTGRPEQKTVVSGLNLTESSSTVSVGPDHSMIMFTNTSSPSESNSGIVSVLGPVSPDTLKLALSEIAKAVAPSVKAPRVSPQKISKQPSSPDLGMYHGYSITMEDPGQ